MVWKSLFSVLSSLPKLDNLNHVVDLNNREFALYNAEQHTLQELLTTVLSHVLHTMLSNDDTNASAEPNPLVPTISPRSSRHLTPTSATDDNYTNPSSPKAGRFKPNTSNSKPFEGERTTDIELDLYLSRLVQYTVCSPHCFVAVIIYIDRLILKRNFVLTVKNIHRLLVSALLLATKLWEDTIYNNAYYSYVGGLPLKELNKWELELLSMLDFDLCIPTSLFESYCAPVDSFVQWLQLSHIEMHSEHTNNGRARGNTKQIRRVKSVMDSQLFASSPERVRRQYSRSLSALSLNG